MAEVLRTPASGDVVRREVRRLASESCHMNHSGGRSREDSKLGSADRVHFRLINMGCCGAMLCCVNERFYNYCPECGRFVYPQIKQWVMSDCPGALLKY